MNLQYTRNQASSTPLLKHWFACMLEVSIPLQLSNL
jgi:hypothetical protein